MFATRASFSAAAAISGKAFRSPAAPPPPPFELPPSKIIEDLLREHGPQTVSDCWKLAEPAGIKSKIRMKALLMWLVGRGRIRQVCHHIKESNTKEFLYGPKKSPPSKGTSEGLSEQ